ncbi:MAG: hypothetical protein GFH27_549347n85 [Chloroflexi bacterium AL-W]|nr:hypothetical protein [Chloroflexi bacterium AL-N5]NOK85408.1 hypothetical protein [Chloroflexi bacterium AL-W]
MSMYAEKLGRGLGALTIIGILTFVYTAIAINGVPNFAQSGGFIALAELTNTFRWMSAGVAASIVSIVTTVSDIALVLSLIAAVVGGAGLISAAVVATVKSIVKRSGKKAAQLW